MVTIKKKHIAVFSAVIAFSLLAVILLGQPLLQNTDEEAKNKNLRESTEKAISFLKGTNQPDALLMMDVIYRRFGIEDFAGSLKRYDQIIAVADSDDASILRVLRRIAVHDNPLQMHDLEAVNEDMDVIIVPALYGDQNGISPNYQEILNVAIGNGGYYLTHVLLASIWLSENGCQVEIDLENVYSDTSDLINDDMVVNDLELEAAAFLYLAEQGSRVSEVFIEKVVQTQNVDGGWKLSSDAPGGSYWHTSVLGLMLLLHVTNPADSYPPMLGP